MKKFLAIVLAIIAAFSLVACGAADNGDGDKTSDTNTQQPLDDGGEGSGDDDGTGGNGGDSGTGSNPDVVQPITDGGSFDGGNYDD